MKLNDLKILLHKALNTKLKKYQGQAILHLERNQGRGILGDDMGLGKTLEAIGWLVLNPMVYPVIIVCPSNIKYQWAEQLKEHAGIDSEILEGTKPYKPLRNVIILNYKILATAKWPGG